MIDSRDALRTTRVVLALAAFCAPAREVRAQSGIAWEVHDTRRPLPPLVTAPPRDEKVPPPSDALVLFDGRDLSAWEREDGTPARWTVRDGYMEIVREAGSVRTRRGFGDVQLHVEWRAPAPGVDSSRYRGNSGVYLMGLYEVQVLDSHRNGVEIYADGQAGALYGQHAPLVNASLPPGSWQTFDIFFRRPRFGEGGRLTRPARVTVLHNGVLVQDAAELTGPTAHQARPPYAAHPDRLPLMLQNHGSPVRFRNIWIRELVDTER
jgi:hypothetical protein